MTALEACRALTELMRGDRDLTLAVSAAVQAKGCKDIYDFADKFPDDIVVLADQVVDVYGQEPDL